MKRLPGVIAAAIVLFLFSLFQLLTAAGMAFAGVIIPRTAPAPPPAAPSWMPYLMFAMSGFFVAFAAWGICSAVGLFRRKRWARYSTLIIGGCMAGFGLISVLSLLALMAIGIPASPTTDPTQTPHIQSTTHVIFGVMVLFYAIPMFIGAWWLIYFNLRKVRDSFNNATGAVPPSPRPLIITILAVLCLIGAPSCLMVLLLPMPGFFFGVAFRGWQKIAFSLLFAALEATAGYGLWKLKEWGRRLALFLQCVGAINVLVYVLRPSLLTSYTNEIDRAMGITQLPSTLPIQEPMLRLSMGLSLVLLVAVAFALHYYRAAFQSPSVPPPAPADAPQLPEA
jgi:uncharacterized membrane protein (DUF2068 family)